ncbi:MAG: FAD-binding protein, partial [Raoultibacter sp.]
DTPDEILETFCQGLTETKQMLIEDFDVPEANFLSWKEDKSSKSPLINFFLPEYPEIEGGDKVDILTVSREELGASHLWNYYRKKILSLSDQIDLWFNAPAIHLYQDPVSNAVIGVEVDHNGKKVNIRALNGVVLCVGGFENNREMAESYLGLTKYSVTGTMYNTGDGIKMGSEVGCDFWHMEAYEGYTWIWGGASSVLKPDQHSVVGQWNNPSVVNGSYIIVGNDGQRYMTEDAMARHGHMPTNGEWVMLKRPASTYIIFDRAQADLFEQWQGYGVPSNCMDQAITANSIAELESALGIQSGNLQISVSHFNDAATTGLDPEFRRSQKSMRAFSEEGPYYALEIVQAVLNTQGGPRRNEKGEVIGISGKPIPHLYSSGECGGIAAYQYNAGGNMAECLIFGRAAGTNAAAQKDPLPPLPTNVKSEIKYKAGNDCSDPAELDLSTIPVGEGEYLGTSTSGMGGQMIVKVTTDGSKIEKIDIVEQRETSDIGSIAVEKMPQMIIDANSTDVDVIATATMSSRAVKDAVADALSKAK